MMKIVDYAAYLDYPQKGQEKPYNPSIEGYTVPLANPSGYEPAGDGWRQYPVLFFLNPEQNTVVRLVGEWDGNRYLYTVHFDNSDAAKEMRADIDKMRELLRSIAQNRKP